MASTVFGDFVFKISAPVRDAINSLQNWDSQLEDTVENTSSLADSSNDVYEQMANDLCEFDKEFGETIENQTETIKESKASWMAFGVAAAAAVTAIGYSVLKWSPHMQMYASLMSLQMQRLGIEVGKILAPLMKLVTDVFKGFVDWFIALGDNDDAVGAFLKQMIVLGGVAFTGLIAAGAVFNGLKWIFGVGSPGGFLSALKGAAGYVAAIAVSGAKAGWAAFTALPALIAANPIVAFAIALAAIAVAVAWIVDNGKDLNTTTTAIIEVNSTLTAYIGKLEEIEEINKRVFGEQGGQMVNSFIEHNKSLAKQGLEYIGILEKQAEELAGRIAITEGMAGKELRASWAIFGEPKELTDMREALQNTVDKIESTRQATRSLIEDFFTFSLESSRSLENLKEKFGEDPSMFELLSESLGFGGPIDELRSTFVQSMTEYATGMSESIQDIILHFSEELTGEQKIALNEIASDFLTLRDSYEDGSITFAGFQSQMELLRDRVEEVDLGKLVPQEILDRMVQMEEALRTKKISQEQYDEQMLDMIDEYGNGIINLGHTFATFDDAQLVTMDNLRYNTEAQEILGIAVDDTGKQVSTFSDQIIDTGDAAIEGAKKMQTAQKSYMGVFADTLSMFGFGGAASIMRKAEKTINYTTINNNQQINAGSRSSSYDDDLSGLIKDMNDAKIYEDNHYYQQSTGGSSGY